jgi:uncharacterized protein with NAD-binding domain and iron-sulfur cluster
MAQKQKIAILGGGLGGMSAAWALVQAPDAAERFEITVYQMGWRLGGKGASGRNQEMGNRIEEHGLHVWSGFYQNAFTVMKDVYAQLKRPTSVPLHSFETAFTQHDTVTFATKLDGKWAMWTRDMPRNNLAPGTATELPTPWQFLKLMVPWAIQYLSSTQHAFVQAEEKHDIPFVPDFLEPTLQRVRALLGRNRNPTGAALLNLVQDIVNELPDEPTEADAVILGALAETFQLLIRWIEGVLRPLLVHNPDAMLDAVILQNAAVFAAGLINDRIIFKGFDAVDDVELCDWMRKHGASEDVVQSGVIQAFYDYIFAYKGGDSTKPALGAGTALRMMFRLLMTYRGSIFWKMNAGMGDTIFAPLYEYLRQRGVQFRFFHQIDALHLNAEQDAVDSVDFGVQVELKNGHYEPLFNVKDLPCWPSEPFYEQLVDGDALRGHAWELEDPTAGRAPVRRFTLRRGAEFDHVVLATSLAPIKSIGKELVDANPRWRRMVDQVGTVRTLALQLWLDRSTAALGWTDKPTILTGYVDPMNTWADLSHLLPLETWPETHEPKSVAYFCGQMSDDEPIPGGSKPLALRADEYIGKLSLEWLEGNLGRLWPATGLPYNPDGLDLNALYSPEAEADFLQKFGAQYWRANTAPAERYVTSLPGTLQARMSAGETGFSNLVLAGDWVRNGLNYGCVESAVLGGLQAARALSGWPQFIYGESDFQKAPERTEVERAPQVANA